MLKGSWVALVTPFKNGRLDEAALKTLVEFHVNEGTDGLVPCGTTGESPTLSHEEHARVVEIVVKAAKGRIPVMAGAGSNSTKETIELVRHAARVGAQSALLVVPYYNKPTPRGLYEHYKAVSRESKLPLVLYNIPSRSAVAIPPEITIQLARDCPTIIGIKEATGSMDYTSQILGALGAERFTVLSGDDSLTLPLMSLGAQGVVSVVANIAPQMTAELCRCALQGDFDEARLLHQKLFPLVRALFLETNPIPVKAAMEKLRLCSEELRLPLVPIGAENRKKLFSAMSACLR
jgi:4-hydroxy-tetrahydrodipicolinate synthase